MGTFQKPTFRSQRPLHFRFRIIIFVAVTCFIWQQHLFHSYHHALAAKYAPTYFNNNTSHHLSEPGVLDTNINKPGATGASMQEDLLSHRKEWSVLGGGWEGTVYSYKNSVIKTFKSNRSPLRNCIHSKTPLMKWPTEIPASLHFGTNRSNIEADTRLDHSSGFLPVQAYFLAPVAPASPPEWHLVTPLIKGGTLNTLAKSIHRKSFSDSYSPTYHNLDAQFRPSFHRLLATLGSMHRDGYCHDDMKPDNIFIAPDNTDWKIADLGNVRHVSHIYHSSRIWSENKQLADCRANDALRALKTYLVFLRNAVQDEEREALEIEILEGKGGLGGLWQEVRRAVKAEELSVANLVTLSTAREQAPGMEFGDVEAPGSSSSWTPMFWRLPLQRSWRRKSVDEVLNMGLSDALARFWSMSWLLGVPESAC